MTSNSSTFEHRQQVLAFDSSDYNFQHRLSEMNVLLDGGWRVVDQVAVGSHISYVLEYREQ